MAKFGGITIGPIVDTLSMVSKPAGLWGASYLFSYLAEQLCLEILKGESHSMGVEAEDFVEPVVRLENGGLHIAYKDGDQEKNGAVIMKDAGVGLLHDRIIWKINNDKSVEENIQEMQSLIAKAKDNTIFAIFGQQDKAGQNEARIREYFQQYLQIKGICVEVDEGQNPLLAISDYLDAVELKKTLGSREERNYVLEYLDNQKIKNVSYFPRTGSFSLAEKDSEGSYRIRDLESICKMGRKGFKTDRYFAIVQADGDNMGKTIAKMETMEEIRKFSMFCIKAALTAYEKVKKYGGYMIYAGGDDLLFLAPLVGKDKNETLIPLLQELSQNFKNLVKEELGSLNLDKEPTLSFGVSIQYYKYPLYEAFAESRYRLFGVAKQEKEKDAISLKVQKHSGQSLQLLLKSVSNSPYTEVLNEFFHMKVENEIMNSVYTQFRLYKQNLIVAYGRDDVLHLEALMKNLFDNAGQKAATEYLNKTLKLAKAFYNDATYDTPEEKVENFLAFLKLVQFYFEKGEE